MTTFAVAAFGCCATAWLARTARRFAVLDRLRAGRRLLLPAVIGERLEPMLERALVQLPAEHVVQLWLLTALAVGAFGVALSVHMAVMGVSVVLVGGPVVLHCLRHRRGRAVTLAVPGMLERAAAELRTGGTVASCIGAIANDVGPLAADFARVQARIDLGASIPQALGAWARERSGTGISSAAGALAVAHDAGGPSADALESLARSLRERLAVIAEAHALSAQARYSALVIGIGPLAYLAFSAMLDRRAIASLVGTAAGRACGVAGILLEITGAFWMRRILAAGATE
jgi:tight adherence protein B